MRQTPILLAAALAAAVLALPAGAVPPAASLESWDHAVIRVEALKDRITGLTQDMHWRVPEMPAGSGAGALRTNWRGLTDGELRMVRPIFRESIDYGRVRVYKGKWNIFQPDNVAMSPNGNSYYPSKLYSVDFSSADFSMRYLFVHEMTHVYQNHQGVDVIGRRLREGGVYKYTLEPDKPLHRYTIEQQGEIIADYYACALYGAESFCKARFDSALKPFFDDPNYIKNKKKKKKGRAAASGR